MFSQEFVKNSVHGGGGHGGGCEWRERRPLQRTVRILLECILVVHNFRLINSTSEGQLSPQEITHNGQRIYPTMQFDSGPCQMVN